MHFSKIYLQDNFVPNVVEDQFRRKVIGIEVTLTDVNDKIENAKELAEQYIKEYIQKNTVYPTHSHIEERTIPESELPEIQVDRGKELFVNYEEVIKEIKNCESISDLKGWQTLALGDVVAIKTFTEKLKQLQS